MEHLIQSRTSYHTSLKELVHYDLLPPKYVGKIPRTNLHRWKHDKLDRHVGSEINAIADNHTELIQTLNQYPRMFYAYGRLVKTLQQVLSGGSEYQAKLRTSKELIVNAIIRTKELVPIDNAIRIFNISRSTFHSWVIDVKFKCNESYFGMCNRIYSNQITTNEVQAIKTVLRNPRTLHWSIRSVYWKGIRDKELSISLGTMYKMNRLLEIRKTKDKPRKKKRKTGIKANSPNQIWHADITTMKTLDNKRHYIYLLIDNFSRKVLSYEIKERVSGLVTARTIYEAYNKALNLSATQLDVKLIVDGGPENNNHHVDSFINQSRINIEKLVALKDIDKSNSMIEALNKTLKYHYIFPKNPRDLKHLKRTLKYFINDYNKRRPHGALNGLTPDEAWQGKQPPTDLRTSLLKQARLNRVAINQENRCEKCDS